MRCAARVDKIGAEIEEKQSEISDAHWWSVPGLVCPHSSSIPIHFVAENQSGDRKVGPRRGKRW